MGQGQIRKGFFFYFGLFVLLLVAIFCICLVIMMFNPGKTVLWMQYFTANDHIIVSKTTDEEPVDINLSAIDTIEINCGAYAEVIVQKTREEAYAKEGIHIINNAKGFQGASGAVHFGYTATLTGRSLELTVTEPKGFLYFSQDVKIVLAAFSDNDTNFSHINLIVNSVDGDVSIGNSGLSFTPKDVQLAGLTVNAAQSGDVVLGDYFNTSTLENLSLKTKKGDIISHNKISYSGKEYSGISAGCETNLITESGRIELGLVNVGGNNLKLDCQTGSVDIDFVKAASTNVICKRGTFDFGTVDGSLNYAGAASDTMTTPYIKVDYITGDFVLDGNEKVEPEIYINRIDGSLHVNADNGKVDVNQTHGEVEIVSSGKLAIDVIVAENNLNQIDVKTNSGNVDMGFLGQFKSTNITTDSGKVVVRVISGIKFAANSYKNNGSNELLDEGDVSVSIELLDSGDARNSFVVDGNDGTLNVYTNESVGYKLVAKTDLIG